MLGKQLNNKNISRYYDVEQALSTYNKSIINPQVLVKDYFTQNFPLIKNSAFITITPVKNYSFKFLRTKTSQLFKYLNEILYSPAERKNKNSIKGLGCYESQHNGRPHFHVLLQFSDVFGENLSRLNEKLKVTIEKLNKANPVYNFSKGIKVQPVEEPEEVMDYMLKETDIRTLDNIFFVDYSGFVGAEGKEFFTVRKSRWH